MNPFVQVYDNVLSPEFCERSIAKFNIDSRKCVEQILNPNNSETIHSCNLQISGLDDWKQEDDVLFGDLNKHVTKYQAYLDEKILGILIFGTTEIKDSGYKIQKTASGEEFGWHQDNRFEDGYARTMTYIWYLNDVPEGGETELYDGTLITPVQGRLILFPATWTFINRGRISSHNKYTITGHLLHKQHETI